MVDEWLCLYSCYCFYFSDALFCFRTDKEIYHRERIKGWYDMSYRQTGWMELIGVWVITSLIFMATLMINAILGVFAGAFIGWLLSLTFLGNWIAAGLNMMNIKIQSGELFKIGAAVGFLSGFLKYSFSFKGNNKVSNNNQ